jgi:hypothetical protein
MASIIGDLAVRVGADTSGLQQGLGEASRGVDSLGAKARASVGTFAAFGAAAAAAGAAVATALVVKGLEAVDAQAKLAKKLDTTSASLAVVKRAGDLAGASMGDIETGGKRLAVVLGQAEGGSKSAAATLDRLGLSASKVASLPLDQRILAVNQAIEANIPVTERAAVSAELFGKSAGFAIASLDAATMADAAKQVELFGLNLSDVDAARVEMANDAMSQISMLVDGISQQLAVNLAPALSAVMRMFTETAEEAGGVGDSVAKASNIGIKAFGFLLDVVDSLKRLFEILSRVAETAIRTLIDLQLTWAESVINGPIWAVNKLIELLNKLPGVDIEPRGLTGIGQKIKDIAAENSAALEKSKIGLSEIDAILQRPMPSGKFAQYIEEAKLAAEATAKAAAGVTGGGGGESGGGSSESRAQKEKADREAEYIAQRLERLREANMTEMQLLLDKQMLELETINAGWEQKFLTDETWNALMLETKIRHEQEITDAEAKAGAARNKLAAAEAAAKKRIMGDALSGLTTLMNSESRKMFEIGKAAAIAQSLISTFTGVTKALELGFPMGLVAAAAVGAVGFANVANIRSQSFGGGGAGAAATGSNTAAINAASTPTAANPAAPSGGTLTVQGLSASSLFSGDAVSALAEELLAYQRRGGSVLLAG